jgi:hypothetical protein
VNADQVDVTARFSRQRLWLPTFGAGTINVSSAVQGGTPLVGHTCGFGCVDYGTGERLVLRASPSAGWETTAWGGTCTSVPADHGCLVTLDRSKVVSATFEPIPPPRDCPPGKSCDPIVVTTTFSVRVTGAGTVTAPQQGMTPQLTCSSTGATGRSCSVDRAVGQTVSVTASGLRFRYWGGRCAGVRSTTCKFKNKRYSGDAAVITAAFG